MGLEGSGNIFIDIPTSNWDCQPGVQENFRSKKDEL